MINSRVAAFRSVRWATLSVLLGAAACGSTSNATKSGPTTARIAEERTVTAAVVAVDKTGRVVTLRGEHGGLTRLRAGEAVRNFDQIAVGDALVVRYQAALQATLLAKGEVLRPAEASLVAGRAPAGAAPAVGAGLQASVRVKIESIDTSRDLLVFSTSSGELLVHRVATDEGREFVRKLHVGDLVQLDYDEALALGIEKASR
jgi:hypothetical protein